MLSFTNWITFFFKKKWRHSSSLWIFLYRFYFALKNKHLLEDASAALPTVCFIVALRNILKSPSMILFLFLWGGKRDTEQQAEFSSKLGQTEGVLLLQGFVQGSAEKAQCKVGLQPTGMDSRAEPKQMGNSIKVNARSIWASVIKLWALLIALF